VQAVVVGTISEHSLPMTLCPVIVNVAKYLAKDPAVLDKLSVGATSWGYKLHALHKTIQVCTESLES
jgi:hypothetical protein